MALNFDRLIIESHINPDAAWSDAAQQITPEVYGQLISDQVIRDNDPKDLKEKTKSTVCVRK